MTKTKQVTVSATDPIKFATLLLELGAKGAKIKNGSYVYVTNLPLSCVVMVPEEAGVDNSPNIAVLPTPKRYTEEELEVMVYADLLGVAKEAGIDAKKKVDIIDEYLKGE